MKNHGQTGNKEEQTNKVGTQISLTFWNPRPHDSDLWPLLLANIPASCRADGGTPDNVMVWLLGGYQFNTVGGQWTHIR